MLVWFVRHAKAVDRNSTSLSDFQRPLTPEGRKQFSHLCRRLAKRVSAPSLILSSPLIRAVQTAEIIRREFEAAEEDCRIEELLRPDFSITMLLDILSSGPVREKQVKSLAIVGHQPSFSTVLESCLGVSDSSGGGPFGGEEKIQLVKGAIAAVEIPSPSTLAGCRLKWLVSPKLLR